MYAPPIPMPTYDPSAVPAAIRNSEVTTRNQTTTARHSQPWTQWKVAYDSAARDNQATGRRAHRG